MLKYSLQVDNAKAHLFAISVQIPQPEKKQCVSLPVWIPGSYLIREFAKNLLALKAFQSGREVSIRQLDKCTWEVDCEESGGTLELAWKVYAFDTSVRTAYLDERRGFVNGTSVFLRVHGQEHEPVALKVHAPKLVSVDLLGALKTNEEPFRATRKKPRASSWKLALALPELKVNAQGFGTYRAANYDELVDSPMEMGLFWQGRFIAGGVKHEFVVTGAPASFDGKRLLQDAKRICEAQIAFWKNGKPPFKQYVFMLNAMDQGYGGLEHSSSTALLCNRRDLPLMGEPEKGNLRSEYITLLGLISHEYFHAWNVKRMRPAELTCYDYSKENYTELLWFFEGFTSYYDDLMLLRAGLITQSEYLTAFAKNIQAVASMPGRKQQPLAQASFDAWIKYYRVDENTPNITVSYYTKGALIAFCLDASLRAAGRGTLDDVMRLLWECSSGGPMTETDIATALKAVGGRSFAKELKNWVHGVHELPVQDGLLRFGVKVKAQSATLQQQLGIKVAEDSSGLIVKTVLAASQAERVGLSAGDEILAINGWRIRSLKDWTTYTSKEQESWLLIARDGMLMRLDLQEALAHQVQGGAVSLVMTPPAQRKRFKMLMKEWPL